MRKMIFALATILLLFTGCTAKEETGPQFICTACKHTFLKNGEITGTDDYFDTYDDRGLVTDSARYEDGILTEQTHWEYDESGNPVRITTEKNDTIQISEYKNTLNEDGRILRQEVYQDGSLLSIDEYTYDQRGNELTCNYTYYPADADHTDWRTYTMTYDWKGNLTRKELQWNFNDEYIIWEYADGLCIRQTSYESETDNVTEYWEYTYDQKGRNVRSSQYDGNGQLKLYNEYLYDDAARTMTRTCFYADGTVNRSSDVYTYDEYGNTIMRERLEDGEVYWRIEYTYELLETVMETD